MADCEEKTTSLPLGLSVLAGARVCLRTGHKMIRYKQDRLPLKHRLLVLKQT